MTVCEAIERINNINGIVNTLNTKLKEHGFDNVDEQMEISPKMVCDIADLLEDYSFLIKKQEVE